MSEQALVNFIVVVKKFLRTICGGLLNRYHFKKELNVETIFLKSFNFKQPVNFVMSVPFLTFALRYL
jgi:hypothetical protein